MNDLTVSAPPMATLDDPAPTLCLRPAHALLLAGPARLVAAQLTVDEVPTIQAYRNEARRLMAPATPQEVFGLIARLKAHYPPQGSDIATDSIWEDIQEDFADVPADMIAAACGAWRRSTERWAPTSGQLLDKVKGPLAMRRAFLKRAEDVWALMTTGSAP